MTEKVRALYDFEAQPDSGELSLREGDVLTVTNKNVGDGWWEGSNSRGQTGFFPEAYIEVCDDDDSGPPSMAPPPLPADYEQNGGGGGGGSGGMGWSSSVTAAATSSAPPPAAAPPATSKWDDDDNWGFPPPPPPQATQQPQQLQQPQQQPQRQSWVGGNSSPGGAGGFGDQDPFSTPAQSSSSKSNAANTNRACDGEDWSSDEENFQPQTDQLQLPASSGHKGSMNDVSSIGGTSKKSSTTAPSGTGIISLSRFSAFVKIGGENFLLGKLGNVGFNEQDVIQVVDNTDDTFSWLNARDSYTCQISNSKKETKFGGLKSFIAYQLTPSFNNIQVSRRYKHFDWLHERLVEKYSMIPIPPLPDKQIQGRYEEEFIEHRRNQLQSFVDRVSSHPVLSGCEVWMHFLTCTDDRRWTSGKRQAEKDPLVGGSLLMTIKAPEKVVYDEFLDRQLEIFNKFHGRFDQAVKGMFDICKDQTRRYQTTTKQEYQKIGKAFLAIGAAMEQDGIERNSMLNNALTGTGEAYEDIAKITDEQAKRDWEPLGDVMHDYKGLLSGWPNVLSIHSDSVKKRKECERFDQEGRLNGGDLTGIRNRADKMSYALMAEVGTFHTNRAHDVKQASQAFLREQIEYYQKITQRLQDALREFDSC